MVRCPGAATVWLGGVFIAMVGACDKSAPPSESPAVEPAAPVEPATPVEPVAGPESEDDEDDLEDDAEEEASSEEGRLDPVDAYNSAESAAAEAMGDTTFVLTPALPSTWPPESDEVEYLAYPLSPMEQGVNQYVLGRAKLRVLLKVGDGSTRTEDVAAKGKPLGKMELGRGLSASDPVRGAERVLFEVVAGQKAPEKAKFLLYRYDKWMDDNGLIGADVRKRKAEFSKFLASVTP